MGTGCVGGPHFWWQVSGSWSSWWQKNVSGCAKAAGSVTIFSWLIGKWREFRQRAATYRQGKDCVVGFVHLTIQWNPCQDVTWREMRTVDIGHSVGVSSVTKIRCFVFGVVFQHPEMFFWNPTMKSLTSDNTNQARGWNIIRKVISTLNDFLSREHLNQTDIGNYLFACSPAQKFPARSFDLPKRWSHVCWSSFEVVAPYHISIQWTK